MKIEGNIEKLPTLDELIDTYIKEVYVLCDYNKAKASRILDITTKTISTRLRKSKELSS